jgi:hypothetical protein
VYKRQRGLGDVYKRQGIYIAYVNADGLLTDTSNAHFKRFLLHQ